MSPRPQGFDSGPPAASRDAAGSPDAEGSLSPSPPEDGGADPNAWSWEYEQQYGAPKLDYRESALHTELDVLADTGRDTGVVVAALRRPGA